MPVCYGRAVAGLRWLLIFAFCAALDLSGPLLPVPAELIEESEEAAHRSEPRRRERPQSGARSPSTRASEVAQGSAARQFLHELEQHTAQTRGMFLHLVQRERPGHTTRGG